MSHRKVVRRASLSDRTNLYRKECEKEAIVWQQLGATEEGRSSALIGEMGETRTDQENTDPVRNLFPLVGVIQESWWCKLSHCSRSSGWPGREGGTSKRPDSHLALKWKGWSGFTAA